MRGQDRGRGSGAVVAVVAGAVLSGVALAACSGPAAGALAGKDASQVLSAGVSAAQHQSSVHYVLEASGQSQRQTITGDAGTDSGDQEIVTGADQVQVELIHGAAFVKGNAGGLQHTIGLPAASATRFAGQWISVQPSDTLFRPITQAVTILGILRQLEPKAPLQESTPGAVGGHEVVGVRGSLPGATQPGVTGTAVLYVSTATPTLPLGFSGQAKNGQRTVTEAGAFSRWGAALHLSAPSGAVPFSSVPTS